MYYDSQYEGVSFPLFFEDHFCGAQTRLINPWIDEEGKEVRVLTLPGTRTGLLFYGWNSGRFVTDVKAVIVTEGAFDSLAIQQALNKQFGGLMNNKFKAIATCGAGVSEHRIEILKGLKDAGIKVILAPDNDEAGAEMLEKFVTSNAITHYVSTGSEDDWNDKLKQMGHEVFAKWFLSRVKAIE